VRKLITRVMFGVDMSLGILIYLGMSLIFGMKFSPAILGFSILCSHLPDVDMVPYLLLRKRFHLVSHQIFFHQPTWFVPVGTLCVVGFTFSLCDLFLVVDENFYRCYLLAIAGSAIFAHFLHDSSNLPGLHWLAPFTWERYAFLSPFGRWWHKVPSEVVTNFYDRLQEKSKMADSIGHEFVSRSDVLTGKAIILYLVSLWLLAGFVFYF